MRDLGLHVDRGAQIEAGRIGQVVLDQVVAAEWAGVADQAVRVGLGQPRVGQGLAVPEMMMGVDDAQPFCRHGV